MKVSELRKLDREQLAAKESELAQEHFNLKFQLHTGHLENSSRIDSVRKSIARVKTILHETA
jgi:large subunit ribosomal protein L29